MARAADSVVPLDRETRLYARKIDQAWQKSVEGILEVGRLLVEAKTALPHGEFERMVRQRCPFGTSTARRLMQIAENPSLSNRAHVHVLPASWGTLAELAKMPEDELKHAIGNRWVKPDLTREEVKDLRARTQKALGKRKRLPKQSQVEKPRPFAAHLRSVMESDVLEWLGSLDPETAHTVAERVARLIESLRMEMTDGQ